MFRKTTNNVSSYTASTEIIIFEGFLYIQGWFNSWKPRYCTLSASRHLDVYYHKEQATKTNCNPIQSIDLSTAISIRDHTATPNGGDCSPYSPVSKSPSPHSPNSSEFNFTSSSLPQTPAFSTSGSYFTFTIETISNDKYLFGCDDEDVLDQWIKHLNVYIFGDIIHSGYMIKQGHSVKNWKKRWFTLSSHWRELKYYENAKVCKESYKGKVDLSKVSCLRYGSKHDYDWQYTMELITKQRTYVFVNTYHEERKEWMNKLEQALKGQNYCSLCDVTMLNIEKKEYYKMHVIYEGYLSLLTQDGWKQSYYAIDGKTVRMFYADTISKMDQFESAVIRKQYYEEYCEQMMDGYFLLLGETIEIMEDDTQNLRELMDDSSGQADTDNVIQATMIIGEPDDDEQDEEAVMITKSSKARGTVDLGPHDDDAHHHETDDENHDQNMLHVLEQFSIHDSADSKGDHDMDMESKEDSKDILMDDAYDSETTTATHANQQEQYNLKQRIGHIEGKEYHKNEPEQVQMMAVTSIRHRARQPSAFSKEFFKFKYKFCVGTDIFGVRTKKELMLWMNALKRVVDFNKRYRDDEEFEYDDERNHLCQPHLQALIRGFLHQDKIDRHVAECMVQFVGNECWDNTQLIAF